MKRPAVIALLLSALFTPITNQAAPADDAASGIRVTEEAWNKDFASKDVARLVAHYTDDASLMQPGAPPAHGKQAIEASYKAMLKGPSFSFKFHSTRIEVAKSGEIAYAEGDFTTTVLDAMVPRPVSMKGNYLTVYKKQADGSW